MTEEKRKELIDGLVKATDPVRIVMQGPFPPEMEMPNEYDALVLYKDGGNYTQIIHAIYESIPDGVDVYVRAENISTYNRNLEYGEYLERNYAKNGVVVYESHA